MPTIPDDHQQYHPQLAELRRRYPQWVIEGPAALYVFTAELRSHGGRSLHFLAGHDVAELAARLATATAAPGAMIVPPCPSCQSGPSEIAWTGGSPPNGADSWRCSHCGYTWTTPPASARGKP